MTPQDNIAQEASGLYAGTASESYTSTFDCEDDSPSIRVVETVAAALEADPADVGPLYETIDPDALDALLEAPEQFQDGCVRFRFEGCAVTVDAEGWIAVSRE